MEKGIDFIGNTVTFFCHDEKGNFVMSRRGKNCRDEQGKYDVGGGAIDFGEKAIEAVRREVVEEYCATILAITFLGCHDILRVQNGKLTHWIAQFFKVQVDPATVKNGEPHKLGSVQWFTKDTLPPDSELHSQAPYFFKTYAKELFGS